MERVVTINLNGNPYQLDESAYDSLRAYLARAEAALVDNPDKGEVLIAATNEPKLQTHASKLPLKCN